MKVRKYIRNCKSKSIVGTHVKVVLKVNLTLGTRQVLPELMLLSFNTIAGK